MVSKVRTLNLVKTILLRLDLYLSHAILASPRIAISSFPPPFFLLSFQVGEDTYGFFAKSRLFDSRNKILHNRNAQLEISVLLSRTKPGTMVSENISLHGISSAGVKEKGAYNAIPEEENEPGSGYDVGPPRNIPHQAGSTSNDLCRLATRVGLVLVLVILLAIYGQRASRIDAIQSVSGADGTIDVAVAGEAHLPLLRPCQIFKSYDGNPTSDKQSRPQVVQTSLSQPSAQWSEISCFESFDTGSSWELIGSLFRGGSNNGASTFDKPHAQKGKGKRRQNERTLNAADRSFQLPSAVIQVDFGATQSKTRPPILGFGGAFTESSALNYNRLSEAGKRAYMELMFGVSGLGYR
jgi:hypothetical protein